MALIRLQERSRVGHEIPVAAQDRGVGDPERVTTGEFTNLRELRCWPAAELGGNGATRALTFLRRALEVARGRPALLEGGIAGADDTRAALAAGAAGVVAGTRFLLTDEARAHPEYQRRILGADKTFRTTLFGLG